MKPRFMRSSHLGFRNIYKTLGSLPFVAFVLSAMLLWLYLEIILWMLPLHFNTVDFNASHIADYYTRKQHFLFDNIPEMMSSDYSLGIYKRGPWCVCFAGNTLEICPAYFRFWVTFTGGRDHIGILSALRKIGHVIDQYPFLTEHDLRMHCVSLIKLLVCFRGAFSHDSGPKRVTPIVRN